MPWMFRKIGKEIEQILELFSANVVHISREGNYVADARAKCQNLCCMSERELSVKAFQAWMNLPINRLLDKNRLKEAKDLHTCSRLS